MCGYYAKFSDNLDTKHNFNYPNKVFPSYIQAIEYITCSIFSKDIYRNSTANKKRIVYIYENELNECKSVSVDANVCFMKRNSINTMKCLPLFIIVGVMKSGTGALMRLN